MNRDYIIAIIAFVVIRTFIYFINMHKIAISKSKKRKRKELKDIIEIKFLVAMHKLNKEKLLNKKIIFIISIIDSFIITMVFLVITLLPYGIFWQLLVGFVLLLGLIYSIYSILGNILSKKGYNE